jgi:hypothetical protein
MAQVLGILKTPSQTAHAVHELKHAGFDELEVYSPCPSHEIEHALDRGPSIVRLYTLVGSLTGVTLAYFIQIWMAHDWPLVIGGKPFASIVAYTIVGFELNILFGGLATVAGLLIHGFWVHRKRDHAAYQPSFSGDEFGCLVDCSADQVARVEGVLRDAGSAEVRVVTS